MEEQTAPAGRRAACTGAGDVKYLAVQMREQTVSAELVEASFVKATQSAADSPGECSERLRRSGAPATDGGLLRAMWAVVGCAAADTAIQDKVVHCYRMQPVQCLMTCPRVKLLRPI